MKKKRIIFILVMIVGIISSFTIYGINLYKQEKIEEVKEELENQDIAKSSCHGQTKTYSLAIGGEVNLRQYIMKLCNISVPSGRSEINSGNDYLSIIDNSTGNYVIRGIKSGTAKITLYFPGDSFLGTKVYVDVKVLSNQTNPPTTSPSFDYTVGTADSTGTIISNGPYITVNGSKVTGKKTFTSSTASISIRFTATGGSEYTFVKWVRDVANCTWTQNLGTNPSETFTLNKNNKSLYACFKRNAGNTSSPTAPTTKPTSQVSSFDYVIAVGTPGGLIRLKRNTTPPIITINDFEKYKCYTDSCSESLTAVAKDGYEFKKWVRNAEECNTGSGIWWTETYQETFSKNKTSIYACFKKINEEATSSLCKIKINYKDNVKEQWEIHDGSTVVKGGYNSNKLGSYDCKTNSCYIKYTGFDTSRTFNGIAGDGDCSTGGRAETKDSKTLWCTNSNGVTAEVCFLDEMSGGGGSGGSGGITTPPTIVTEPVVQDKFTVNVNSYVWAKGKEYMGNSISCGDKLYVTKCTSDNEAVCVVTSINDKRVTTTTQIYKNNYTTNESDTGCFKDITRYISEKTYSYTNSSLDSGKTEVSCGTTVVFKEAIDTACTSLSCKVNINDKTVYVERDKIVSDKPACEPNKEDGTCTSSERVTDLKGVKNIKLCKKDDTEENRDKIVTCASDYEVSYNLVNDKCTSTSSDNCYREYKYNCSYIKRPSLSVSAGTLGANGTGTITIYGKDNGNVGLKGYFISSGDQPTQNSDWIKFSDTSYKAYETKTAGSYFVWVLNNKNRMSYQIMGKVFDADMSTTLQTFSASDASGNYLLMKGLDDNSVAYNGVVDSKYALLSNKLLESAEIAGFESLTTAYEINVVSNKVALYATLTSNDANYVSGYEPRTIDLDYGRNVALIKIVNNKGKERTYTFIINRIDDRDGSNLLSSLTISKGKLNFDSYVSSYDVSIPKNTKKVSINGTLVSDKAAFIQGYEPREITITEDVQSAVLKVRSESGSIRSYVVTFTRNGSDDQSEDNSTYLSSLSVPGTQLGFNKEVYDYTISVPYDTETIPIYAFGESSKAVVNVSNNSGLKVGNNLVEIEVKNGNKTRIYSIHVIRKESGLDISNSNKLAMLSVKNYNINFNPDILDYVVKIKREKSLLITASPESNRADIYMVGNNDLTGFSTIRVKVIAENGLTNIYSIDIQKDPYNKTIEIIAAVAGGLIFVGTAIIVVIRRKRKKMKEYLEE